MRRNLLAIFLLLTVAAAATQILLQPHVVPSGYHYSGGRGERP